MKHKITSLFLSTCLLLTAISPCNYAGAVNQGSQPQNSESSTDSLVTTIEENVLDIQTITVNGHEYEVSTIESDGTVGYTIASDIPVEYRGEAEMALRMAADPEYEGIMPLVDAFNGVDSIYLGSGYGEYSVYCSEEAANEPDAHCYIEATWDYQGASTGPVAGARGKDTFTGYNNSVWYGDGTPTKISIKHTASVYLKGATVEVEISSTPKLIFKPSKTKLTASQSGSARNKQVYSFQADTFQISYAELQGAKIHSYTREASANIDINNTSYQPTAQVDFYT